MEIFLIVIAGVFLLVFIALIVFAVAQHVRGNQKERQLNEMVDEMAALYNLPDDISRDEKMAVLRAAALGQEVDF